MSEIKKGVSRFHLLGKVRLTDKTFLINQKGKNNANYLFNQLDLSVDCGNEESNIVHAGLIGGYDITKDSVIYCHGTKEENGKVVDDFDNQIQIPFSKRNEENKEVAESCYIVVAIVKDTAGQVVKKKFLSAYDVVAYLKDNLENNMVVSVRGNLKYTTYQGKTQTKKEITSIWISNAEQKDFKASFEQQVWFTQEGFNGSVDENNYLPIYGYVVDYYNKEVKNVCYPFTIDIDTKLLPKYETIIKNYLRPEKKENVNKVSIEGRWIKTDNSVEVSYDDLSEDLKAQVDLGMLTQEEALGRAIGSSRGEYKTILKSICTRTDKDTGVITLLIDKDNSKVEDIITPPQEQKDEVVSSVGSESETKKIDDNGGVSQSVLDDLFGA